MRTEIVGHLVQEHCTNCGTIFDISPLDAAEPTQVVFCGDCFHLWQDREWWVRLVGRLQEIAQASGSRHRACSDHLSKLIPPAKYLTIAGHAVKRKEWDSIKIKDALAWLQAFHPGAYEAFMVKKSGLYVDLLEPQSEPFSPISNQGE